MVLIGIDRYPPRYRSLFGCVNDIDAIEQLLLTPPGVGIPPEQVRITRLAAPRDGRPSTSQLLDATLAPTKANLVRVLQELTGPAVKPTDRILIYYSGHGDEKLLTGRSVWREALVPHNDQDIEYLFDVEINALINAIAARTSDLTIALDCCHSAGAIRDLSDIDAQGEIRALASDDAPIAPPDLAALGVDSSSADDRGLGLHLLQTPAPSYLVVAACQPDEKAAEGAQSLNEPAHGVFTHSLLSLLNGKDADQRAQLRWADIWPELLAKVAERNAALGRRRQHPWMIGESARRVFGGDWEPMDVGYRISDEADGRYEIGAGRLMGITEGAELAVYGREPLEFKSIGSPEDKPVGRLTVTKAEPARAIATTIDAAFVLPEGARARLVKPGQTERLRVSLKPEDATLLAQLEQSPLLAIVPATAPDADVEVIAQPDRGWIIGNDTERVLAVVPPGELEALRAGLEHYYRYTTVLRMAHRCNDPELSNSLSVRLLDCNDADALQALSPEGLTDPDLPEALRDSDRIYALLPRSKFCLKVINTSTYHLNVTLLNCSAGGLVEYLSDAVVRDGAAHVMWLDNQLGVPFEANPDELPADHQRTFTTDRLIVIGTTRQDIDLHSLEVDKLVQDVVNENLSTRGDRSARPLATKTSTAPVELWTATVTPVRHARGQ